MYHFLPFHLIGQFIRFAHWCYLAAGALTLVALREKDDVVASTEEGNMQRMSSMPMAMPHTDHSLKDTRNKEDEGPEFVGETQPIVQ